MTTSKEQIPISTHIGYWENKENAQRHMMEREIKDATVQIGTQTFLVSEQRGIYYWTKKGGE